MRIICPKCDAQYEVPDEVVPEEGRDVQCSNCGNTWYLVKTPERAASEESAAPVAKSVVRVKSVDARRAEKKTAQPPVDRPQSEAASQSVAERHVASKSPSLESKRSETRRIDQTVEEILRSEAEREVAARSADAAALEVQQDLGLQQTVPPARRRDSAQHIRPARSAAEGPVPDSQHVDQATSSALSRRELLPDIEEINSSLRTAAETEETGSGTQSRKSSRAARRSGFRRGLILTLLVFALALIIYAFAPQLVDAIPAADTWVSAYVTWVDNTRVALDTAVSASANWFDMQAQSFMQWLDELTTTGDSTT